MMGTPANGLPGTTITYTYQVMNVGDVDLSSVALTDDRLGAVALSSTALAPGEHATGTKSYVIAAGDLPGPLTNVATATGASPTGQPIQGQASSTTGVTNPNPPTAPSYIYLPIIAHR